MLDDETNMLAHHDRKMGNKTILVCQQELKEDPELFSVARPQITDAV